MLQSRIYRGFLITKDCRAEYTAIGHVNPEDDRTCFTSQSKDEIKNAIDGYWSGKELESIPEFQTNEDKEQIQ
jgi:hypothetical protein